METACTVSFNDAKIDNSLLQLKPLSSLPRYKPSRFNARTLTEDGFLVLYNSYTGHSCGFPGKAVPRVESFLQREGVQGPLDKLGQYLFRKGYIVGHEVDEDARWDVRYGLEQYRTDVLQLILLACEDCNFRCVYCSQEFKRGVMLPNVRRAVRKLVEARAPSIKQLAVSWFGGEPMVGYEAIEELAPSFQKITSDHGISYESGITTNAYLLTPDRSAKMVEWGIVKYQITVDGGPEQHDAHRPLKEGGGTFQRIIDNVVAMKKLQKSFQVNLRVNFDNTNVNTLTPLFEILKSGVGDDERFRMCFFPVEKMGGPNDETLDVCGVRDAATAWKGLTDQARSMGLQSENLSAYLEPDHGVCYAARPFNFIVGADGKLMKCTVVLDTMPDNIVGRIADNGSLEIRQDAFVKWVKPYYKSDTMCQKCHFVPVCQGVVCPLPRVRSGERPCPPDKLLMRETLKYAWKEKVGQGLGTLVRITNAEPASVSPA